MTQTPTQTSPFCAALEELQNAARHHNAGLEYSQDRPVTVSMEGATIILSSEEREERFSVHQDGENLILSGRGGSFNLTYTTSPSLALQTVMPLQPLRNAEDLLTKDLSKRIGTEAFAQQLYQMLMRAGFTVRTSRMLRWKYHVMVWLGRAERLEASGSKTILWFEERVADWEGGSDDICVGDHWLSTYHVPEDQETYSIFGMTDEEQQTAFGEVMPLPDALHTYGWAVRTETVNALIDAAVSGTLASVQPPGLVPQGFYTEKLYEQHAQSTYTRQEAITQAQAERERRELLACQTAPTPHAPVADSDLPFEPPRVPPH